MDAPQAPAPSDDGWAEQIADTLRSQRARARDFLAALAERQRRARAELEAWTGQGRPADTHGVSSGCSAAQSDELALLRRHRDRLEEKLLETEGRLDHATERLEAMERRLAQAWHEIPESSRKAAEVQHQRSDHVMEDLRRMRTQMEEPRPRAQGFSAKAPPTASPGGILDWEAEKRRIMAALEAEGNEDAEDPKRPREEIAEVLRRTDVIVSDKEREISELKRLLENQSANLGSVAVGAAALEGILDQDAIIQEERENLRRAEAEWQEKIRNAEIEISIERAKLARQRAEIEESLRAQNGDSAPAHTTDPASPRPDKPSGRWLARLGLKDGKGA